MCMLYGTLIYTEVTMISLSVVLSNTMVVYTFYWDAGVLSNK